MTSPHIERLVKAVDMFLHRTVLPTWGSSDRELVDEMRRAWHALDTAPPVAEGQWIACETRYPKNDERVLAHFIKSDYIMEAKLVEGFLFDSPPLWETRQENSSGGGYRQNAVDRWMPIPPPAVAGKESV